MPLAGPTPPAELGGYRLGPLLGEGGMGAVYRATDAAGAEVVLKLIHPRFRGHGSAAARFAREASVTAALSHPAIVQVLAADIDGPQPFIAMEFVPGRTLGSIIRDEGPLGLRRATGLAEQLLSALADAHRHGIAHRDLKPANVMVTETADGQEVVRVLDFGIAGLFDDARHTRLTQTGQVLGTPGYLAPEQAQGLDVDGRADLWAVGVMLYAMLAQRLPFPGEATSDRIIALLTMPPVPLASHRPNLPPAVVAAVERMLAKEPGGRYQTATEAALALGDAVPRGWVDGQVPQAADPASAAPPATVDAAPPTRQAGDAGDARDEPRPIALPPPGAAPPASKAPAAAGPRREERPAGEPSWSVGRLALLGGAVAVAVVIVAGVAWSASRNGGDSAVAVADGGEEALAPLVPVELDGVPAVGGGEPGAGSDGGGDGNEGAEEAARAEGAARRGGRGSRRGAETGAGAGTGAGPTLPAPPAPSAGATTCPQGAHTGTYGMMLGSPPIGYESGIYHAIQPVFWARGARSCLVGVRPGEFSIFVETNAEERIVGVRFPNPGPLTTAMQACLSRRMIAESTPGAIRGPGTVEIRGIQLVCH